MNSNSYFFIFHNYEEIVKFIYHDLVHDKKHISLKINKIKNLKLG